MHIWSAYNDLDTFGHIWPQFSRSVIHRLNPFCKFIQISAIITSKYSETVIIFKRQEFIRRKAETGFVDIIIELEGNYLKSLLTLKGMVR